MVAQLPHATPMWSAYQELNHAAATLRFDELLPRVCEVAAEVLDVERVGVWFFVEQDRVLRCANLFERSKATHSAGAVLRRDDFPIYFSTVILQKSIPATIASDEPGTAELAKAYLQPLGITSMLDAGIFVEERLIGVLCHEHVGPPRQWSPEAGALAVAMAELLAARWPVAHTVPTHSPVMVPSAFKQWAGSEAILRLAAGIADEFQQVLQQVITDTTGLSAALTPELQARCTRIKQSAQRGMDLAHNLLTFASLDQQPPQSQHLAVLTVELLPVLHAALGTSYTLHAEQNQQPLGQVLINKTVYLRILMNLIANARAAMPQGGQIVIRLRAVQHDESHSHPCPAVLVEVIDGGQGINEARSQDLFVPYSETSSQTNRLGLATVSHLVDRVGGVVQVANQPTGGTAFRVFFPVIGTTPGLWSEAEHEMSLFAED